MPPRFEHEDDDEHEDELWLRLRRFAIFCAKIERPKAL
jgi:hypothetical protein